MKKELLADEGINGEEKLIAALYLCDCKSLKTFVKKMENFKKVNKIIIPNVKIFGVPVVFGDVDNPTMIGEWNGKNKKLSFL